MPSKETNNTTPPLAAETKEHQELNASERKEELELTKSPEVSSGMFVAVVYSNCNSFFLGKVLNTKDGILSISSLEEIDGISHVFAWPP